MIYPPLTTSQAAPDKCANLVISLTVAETKQASLVNPFQLEQRGVATGNLIAPLTASNPPMLSSCQKTEFSRSFSAPCASCIIWRSAPSQLYTAYNCHIFLSPVSCILRDDHTHLHPTIVCILNPYICDASSRCSHAETGTATEYC